MQPVAETITNNKQYINPSTFHQRERPQRWRYH